MMDNSALESSAAFQLAEQMNLLILFTNNNVTIRPIWEISTQIRDSDTWFGTIYNVD